MENVPAAIDPRVATRSKAWLHTGGLGFAFIGERCTNYHPGPAAFAEVLQSQWEQNACRCPSQNECPSWDGRKTFATVS